jgi:glycosyltransferase involved in cell wall biosynthesis
MRFKIVQAMAAGVPVVSTTFGADGTDAVNGEHLLLADTPGTFAAAIARTLRRPAETAERVTRARSLVVDRYDWGRILPAYDDLLHSLKRRVSV